MSTAPGLVAVLPIRTPRLLIRPFTANDADALYELHRDVQVTQYAGGTKTRQESQASLQRLCARGTNTGLAALAVEEQGSGMVIGWAGVQPIPEADRVPVMGESEPFELIYALRPDRWGRGLATEAASALLAHAFRMKTPYIETIYALVFPQNLRSIRVLEKVRLRFLQSILHKGTNRHACLYAVSRDDFNNYLSSSK